MNIFSFLFLFLRGWIWIFFIAVIAVVGFLNYVLKKGNYVVLKEGNV